MSTPRTQFLQRNGNHSHQGDARLVCDEVTVQFRPTGGGEAPGSDDSDYCSPPMWKSSPSSPRSAAEPLLGGQGHRSLSPNSRTQAIVRGRMELMEMVKGLPESSYELSLKDIVEHHRMDNQAGKGERLSDDFKDHLNLRKRGVQESKMVEKNGIRRNGRVENKGMFLKVFPVFDVKSKRKKVAGNNSSGRVSPKPEAVKGAGERDWWKKKFTGSSDSDSSRISYNSGSSGSTATSGSSGGSFGGGSDRKKQAFLCGCWPFYQSRRRKSAVSK